VGIIKKPNHKGHEYDLYFRAPSEKKPHPKQKKPPLSTSIKVKGGTIRHQSCEQKGYFISKEVIVDTGIDGRAEIIINVSQFTLCTLFFYNPHAEAFLINICSSPNKIIKYTSSTSPYIIPPNTCVVHPVTFYSKYVILEIEGDVPSSLLLFVQGTR